MSTITPCDLLNDCPGAEAQYMVWLKGDCNGNPECQGHPACERCTAIVRSGERHVTVTRCCTLAVAP